MSCVGEVKSFNDAKGWGFIVYEGSDVFVHIKDCKDGKPVVGDAVTFEISEDPVRNGQMKAQDVTGCTGEKDAGKGCGKGKGGWGDAGWGGGGKGGGGGAAQEQTGTGACQGSVKSFSEMKGWGFIVYEGQDVFVHAKDCQGGQPQKGDWLTFDVEEDAIRGAGQLKAINVTGGTGWESGGKGGIGFGFKGDWSDKGAGKGWGPMWGPQSWGAGPYGKGGKGWDDGWGGKGKGKVLW